MSDMEHNEESGDSQDNENEGNVNNANDLDDNDHSSSDVNEEKSEISDEPEEMDDDGGDIDDDEDDNDDEDDGLDEPEQTYDDSDDDDDEDDDQTREVVVPGQVIGVRNNDQYSGFGTITDSNNNIVSLYVGFKQHRGKYLNVVPFKGNYIPHVGDKVIGKIVDKNVVLWKLDINSPYIGILRPSDTSSPQDRRSNYRGKSQLRRRFSKGRRRNDTSLYDTGDLVIAKILKYDRTSEPSLTTVGPDLGKIKGGFLTDISVPKIPRLIGKSGSMIKMLNSLTSCKIFVAQNGVVWIKGKNPKEERVILKAVKKIENEAHTMGLTDRIKEFVKEELAKIN